jgi:hypothetical protein
MIPPVNAPISSPFGPRSSGLHSGVDYKVPVGASISASASGTVVRASYHPDYGNVIVIDHGTIGPNGERIYTLYAHLNDMNVKLGDTVSEGQSIGSSGGALNDPRRGRSTGPHLHFEVIQSPDGKPLPWRPTGPMGVPGKKHRLDPKGLFPDAREEISPIILDLDGDGIETTNVKDGAYFDHDGNGFAEQTGWAGADDGLLVFDRDGNGTIDSGKELFGSETILSDGSKASNGFEALAELDDNHDGKIDASDAAFARKNRTVPFFTLSTGAGMKG